MNEVNTDQEIQHEAQRRRTFGIISHPDAGKTTITEKLCSIPVPFEWLVR